MPSAVVTTKYKSFSVPTPCISPIQPNFAINSRGREAYLQGGQTLSDSCSATLVKMPCPQGEEGIAVSQCCYLMLPLM